MTWNFNLLFDVRNIPPKPVTLLDGKLTYDERCEKV